MAEFSDIMGRKWTVELDAELMGEVRDVAKVDLADVGGNGYLKIESDPPSLVAVLKILCRESIKSAGITPNIFGKAIRKDAITNAAAAVFVAAADFFPTKAWSEIQSRLTNTREMKTSLASLTPILTMLDEPGIPQRLKDAVMSAIGEQLRTASIDSKALQAVVSATGQDATQSNAAGESAASAA